MATTVQPQIRVVETITAIRAPLESFVSLRPMTLEALAPTTDGYTRERSKLPISHDPVPSDATLFEHPGDANQKYYLPRYRLRERSGRYEIAVAESGDGAWTLSAGLDRYPAPELQDRVRGAAELEHRIAVFIRYGAGSGGAIERRVDFTEVIDEEQGVTVSVRLSLAERDALLLALQSTQANPQLIVRRAIEVAAQVPQAREQETKPQVLVRGTTARAELVTSVAVRELALTPLRDSLVLPERVKPPRDIAEPARPVATYRTVQEALDDVVTPDPFVLDPRLHAYLYDGVSQGGASADLGFRRIVHAHPQGTAGQRFHAYFQDQSQPRVFYYLPDRFRLARSGIPPYAPLMMVHMATEDGSIESLVVTIDYFLEPNVDLSRLAAAGVALKSEIPRAIAGDADVELRPLQATARLKLWLPGAGGPALRDVEHEGLDLANGFLHSVTLPLEGFRQVYASAYSRDVTSLFTGQVLVETGLSSPEPIPLEVRFADTEGEVLEIAEMPEEDESAVQLLLRNAIESPVRIHGLPVRLRRGDLETDGNVEGVTFDPAVELAPGEELALRIALGEDLPGDEPLLAIVDTSGVEILPDPDRILALVSDTSVPAEYVRQIEVETLPELLGEDSDEQRILQIRVEFRRGGTVRLDRNSLLENAHVRMPLGDLILGRDVEGKYEFRQTVVRRSGAQSDSEWRESDQSFLIVPML